MTRADEPPVLPGHVDMWSAPALARWLGVPVRQVRHHAGFVQRGHTGHWRLSREEAQRVVNRIHAFGRSTRPRQGTAL